MNCFDCHSIIAELKYLPYLQGALNAAMNDSDNYARVFFTVDQESDFASLLTNLKSLRGPSGQEAQLIYSTGTTACWFGPYSEQIKAAAEEKKSNNTFNGEDMFVHFLLSNIR